jgi:hypothetical protein
MEPYDLSGWRFRDKIESAVISFTFCDVQLGDHQVPDGTLRVQLQRRLGLTRALKHLFKCFIELYNAAIHGEAFLESREEESLFGLKRIDRALEQLIIHPLEKHPVGRGHFRAKRHSRKPNHLIPGIKA